MTNNVKLERTRYKLTQSELAEKVGVSRQSINAIEKGRYNPSIVLALKIAKTLQISVESLFQLENSD
ncbi:MAG: helix-turn-helix transcriptional regulator [Cryomorphaceae bacterium]|nr:helix-turn-helix transcriptional regulator [Cryomorphaceae bacterium]